MTPSMHWDLDGYRSQGTGIVCAKDASKLRAAVMVEMNENNI